MYRIARQPPEEIKRFMQITQELRFEAGGAQNRASLRLFSNLSDILYGAKNLLVQIPMEDPCVRAPTRPTKLNQRIPRNNYSVPPTHDNPPPAHTAVSREPPAEATIVQVGPANVGSPTKVSLNKIPRKNNTSAQRPRNNVTPQSQSTASPVSQVGSAEPQTKRTVTEDIKVTCVLSDSGNEGDRVTAGQYQEEPSSRKRKGHEKKEKKVKRKSKRTRYSPISSSSSSSSSSDEGSEAK